jgi:hypothetical protein
VSPNGGEQLTLGQQKIISFEAQGLKSYSVALYKNDQWLLWLARDVVVANPAIRDEFGYPWTPSEPKYGDDLNNAVYKIYITGQKADGAGYVDDKSDAPFSFIATNPTQTNPVVISSFTAPSPSVAAGQSTTLSWASNLTPSDFETYGGFCGIEGLTTDNRAIQVFNGHKASGSVTVVPDSTTTYTLLCSSGGKDGSPSAQKSVTVSISASPLPTPIVNSFTATPSLITAGQSSKLSWHASNTEYGGCYLFEGSSTQSITPSNNWGGSGSFTVTPSATKSYTIWCTSSWKDGSPTAQKSLTVTVNAPTQSGPTRVHMLGVYEGSYPSGGGHSYGYHPEGTINVALSGFTLTPTVLVLTSYEPVNWIISNPDNVPIQKVMTAGYYAQRVTGINASVPIEHKANLYTYTQGDAKYASILNWLSSVGLPQPSSFSGSYTGANFTIYTGDKGAAPATSNYASASNDTQLANALGALETGLNALLNLLK